MTFQIDGNDRIFNSSGIYCIDSDAFGFFFIEELLAKIEAAYS
jgi:hypothetical protein